MERKHYALDLRQADLQQHTFSGHASIFGVPDASGDVVMPGAFAKTIAEWGPQGKNRIKVLAQHRSDWLPIGKPIELREDESGLFFTAQISDTALGRDVLTLLRDGVLTEMSIGFDTIKATVEKSSGFRRIHEVRLYEISPVTWAMQPAARITEVRALNEEPPEFQADDGYLEALQAGAEPDASTRREPVAAGPSADPSAVLAQSLRELNAEMKAYLYWRRP